MKIDPKQIAKMITEDPDEVNPLDNIIDEYGYQCDVCEKKRDFQESLSCDICQDVYGLIGPEISRICGRCNDIKYENGVGEDGMMFWDSEINGSDWYVNFNVGESYPGKGPNVVCPGCLSKRKVWQNPQVIFASAYNLYDLDGNLI